MIDYIEYKIDIQNSIIDCQIQIIGLEPKGNERVGKYDLIKIKLLKESIAEYQELLKAVNEGNGIYMGKDYFRKPELSI